MYATKTLVAPDLKKFTTKNQTMQCLLPIGFPRNVNINILYNLEINEAAFRMDTEVFGYLHIWVILPW